MEKLSEIDLFASEVASLTKIAGKEKIGRNKLKKQLDRLKSDYSKHKKEFDQLSAEDSKLKAKLDKSRELTTGTRSKMMKLHNAVNGIDVADASDVIFYDNDDTSYIIGGKEYHLDIGIGGDLSLIPWREFRKSQRPETTLDTEMTLPEFEQEVEDADLEVQTDEDTKDSVEEESENDESEEEEENKPLSDDDRAEIDDFYYKSLWS